MTTMTHELRIGNPEDGEMPRACEVCGWTTDHGVCPECLVTGRLRYDLKPVQPSGLKALLKALWAAVSEPVREDWQTHKRMTAERRAEKLAAKTVLP
jgi:hypothetical protein